MNRNFRITPSFVEFSGEFGVLDVHNAYDLVAVRHDPVARTLVLDFLANEHCFTNKPRSFHLEVAGLQSLEYKIDAEEPYDFYVEHITFMAPIDRDYDVVTDDDGVEDGNDLVLKLGRSAHLRIGAAEAMIVLKG